MKINIDSSCRMCLKSSAVTNVFDTQLNYKSSRTTCFKVINAMFLLNMQEGDGFPPNICRSCFTKLASAYKLKVLAEHSHKQLLIYLSSSVAQDAVEKSETHKLEVKEEIKIEYELKNEDGIHIADKYSFGYPQESVKSEADEKVEEKYAEENSTGAVDDDGDDEDDLPLVMVVDEAIRQSGLVKLSNTELVQHTSLLSERKKTGGRKEPHEPRVKMKLNGYRSKEARGGVVCEVCEVCGKQVRDLRQHSVIHKTERKRVQCPDCPRSFFARPTLKRHRAVVHLGQLYYCKICDKNYKRRTEHIRLKHSNLALNFQCMLCSRKFLSKTLLIYHLRQHSEEKPYPCDVCGKCFRTKTLYVYHKRRVHDREKKNICQYCSKGFFSVPHLNVHLRIHTKEKKYKCKECDKKFRTTSSLNIHMRRHEGVKQATCSVCHKDFLNNGALKAHMISHTKEKVHPCKYCGVMFGRTDHRNRHQRTAHESKLTSNK